MSTIKFLLFFFFLLLVVGCRWPRVLLTVVYYRTRTRKLTSSLVYFSVYGIALFSNANRRQNVCAVLYRKESIFGPTNLFGQSSNRLYSNTERPLFSAMWVCVCVRACAWYLCLRTNAYVRSFAKRKNPKVLCIFGLPCNAIFHPPPISLLAWPRPSRRECPPNPSPYANVEENPKLK